jgi:hypothetical protein
MTRIPHPKSDTEVRQAFQAIADQSSVITTGPVGSILIGQGVGVNPIWTTELTALTKLTVDNITIDAATIVSDTGAISFSDENLTTTGSGTFNFIDIPEITTPASPDATKLRLFVEDFKGFSFFSFIDDTGMVRKIVRDSVFVAKNVSGSTILANRAVYASGSSEGVPTIEKARANNINTMPAIGVTLEDIDHNAFGRIMQVGLVENVDTSSFSAGDVLYVSSAVAGILVATAPLYPNIRQEIGTVLVSDASVGTVQVVARSMFNEGILDHGGLLGLADDDHTQYLLADGSRELTDDMTVTALKTIDGRDLSVDGTKLDGIEALADVTDATNVAAAGAAMAGGAYHDGFSDFVANEHIDHSAVSVTAGDGLTGGGTIASTRTIDLDIAKLSTVTIIASGDYVPFEQIAPSVTNKKITFANFEGALNHDSLTGFVANEHIDHTAVSISSGTGLTGGGTIAATRTLSLSHLGIESLSDPGADRILFWDDGATKTDWLTIAGTANTAASGSAINGTTMTVNAGYVDRGDPSAWDFTEGDLTQDGSWYDLDLSSIVPAGAYAVHVRVILQDTAINQFISFRKNGNSNAHNATTLLLSVANVNFHADAIIACDSSRVIEYRDSGVDSVDFLVRGWFI